MATKKGNALSNYEKERLERIKENEKMLEQLFPDGADAVYSAMKKKRPMKQRRTLDGNSRGSGSGASSDGSDSDQEQGSRKRSSIK